MKQFLVLPVILAIIAFAMPAIERMQPEVFAQERENPAVPAGSNGQAGSAPVKAPISTFEVYLDAFHFHSGAMENQMEIHHYCAQLNEDFIQCILYDGNGPEAHLMGVEYVISEKLFKGLPMEERKLWHSHAYEVKSGQLISPNLPDEAEKELMRKLISTYGKTWHTWGMESAAGNLPLGIPSLMMAFNADGQIHAPLLEERDKRFGISTEEKKKNRNDIEAPAVQPGADSWQTAQSIQLELKEKPAERAKTGKSK